MLNIDTLKDDLEKYINSKCFRLQIRTKSNNIISIMHNRKFILNIILEKGDASLECYATDNLYKLGSGFKRHEIFTTLNILMIAEKVYDAGLLISSNPEQYKNTAFYNDIKDASF